VVYVIDDNPDDRNEIAEVLRAKGTEVIGFRSGRDYLDYSRSDESSCLILDLELSDMSGLDLQSKLAGQMGPPVIFVSGECDIRATVRAMRAGAVDFLTKPVDPEALVAAIRVAFSKDREVRRSLADLARLKERFALLTIREREVLPLVVSGMPNKQAAAILGITEVTVQVHRGQIMKKMEASAFADLIRMADSLGIPSDF
jgi:FixJ family two-component response regulator